MKFYLLHCHSTYSQLDGYGDPRQWADRVEELGHGGMAVTDHGNICAHAPFAKEFGRRGLKTIYGCEFYVVDDLAVKERAQRSLGASSFPHVTLLALTGKGYEALLRLHNEAWRDGFWHKPRTTWEQIRVWSERAGGGLAVLSGCPLGYPTQLILNKGPEAAYDWLAERAKEVEEFHVELVPSPGLEMSDRSLAWLAKSALELGIPTVLTSDAHYPRESDFEAEDALLRVGTGGKLSLGPDYYACTAAELLDRGRRCLAACPEAQGAAHCGCPLDAELTKGLLNAANLADRAEVELPRAKSVSFYRRDKAPQELLWEWITSGFEERQRQGLIPPEQRWSSASCPASSEAASIGTAANVGASSASLNAYAERAAREWRTLANKGFCGYVLIVADLVKEMKSRGALVVARGSAGGSMVCWLAGITTLDPIKHSLSWERFFDETRDDDPDIDLDFSERWRAEAIDYLRGRYGADHCALLANFNTLGAKAAVRVAARALGLAPGAAELLSAAVTSTSDDVAGQLAACPDPRVAAVLNRAPGVAALARALVGQIQNQGIHAAGVLVSSEPLDGRVGLMRGAKGQQVAALDKRGAKSLGYLKIDVLLVDTLGVVERCLAKLGRDAAWLEALPLDDERALATARAGWLAGIFQLDGPAAWRVAKAIGLDTFEDLAMASALCRPGPADWVPLYAVRKARPELLNIYLRDAHPRFTAIVRPTNGLVVTQEQVMRMAWELAGWSDREVHQLRRDIGDKLGTQSDLVARAAWLYDNQERWLAGVRRTLGLGWEADAQRWWTQIAEHGAYSFNRSHCWTYALVGYWMLYLKAHHSAEFYEAYLAGCDDDALIDRLLTEFQVLGGAVELLDPGAGARVFHAPRPGVLAGGWCNLAGQGQAGYVKVGARCYAGWGELLTACPPVLRARLAAARAGDGSALVQLAPWFPRVPLPADAEELRRRHRLPRLGHLCGAAAGGARVVAYVAQTDRARARLTLKDGTGYVPAAVARRAFNEPVAAAVRALACGDLVVVDGWWSGDCLYVKSVAVARPATEVNSKTVARTRKADKDGRKVVEAV